MSRGLKKNIAIIIAALIALVLIAAGTVAWAYRAEQGFAKAGRLLDEGRPLEALAAYHEVATTATRMDERARALVLMGNTAALYLEQPETATKYFHQCLKDYPASPWAGEALFSLGAVLFEAGDYPSAAKAFKTYLAKYPSGEKAQSAQVWHEQSVSLSLQQVEPAAPAALPLAPTAKSSVRVLIVQGAKRVSVESAAPFSVQASPGGQPVHSGQSSIWEHSGGALFFNGRQISGSRAFIKPSSGPLSVNGKRYRGELVVAANPGGGVDVINSLDMEHYLYSVVPKEMPSSWPQQALMAQAVAARSYAFYLGQKRQAEPYDVMATTASQVYGGLDSEAPSARQAVEATSGQIMLHRNNPIIAYFHSHSGGHTEAAGKVWVADLPYLSAIPDPYSAKATGLDWQCVLTPSEIRQIFSSAGMDTGQIKAFSPQEITPSGRVGSLRAEGGNGVFQLKGNSFRVGAGATKVRSTRFTVQKVDGGYLLKGSGYGHGVGMSQWGARIMAQEGLSYQDILGHYYQGVTFKEIG